MLVFEVKARVVPKVRVCCGSAVEQADLMPVSKAACKAMDRGWSPVYSGNGTTCIVNNLSPGCGYQFRVRAGNVAGYGAPSPSASIMSKPGPPETPTSLSVCSRESTSLGVSWKPPEHDGGSRILSYQLQCCKSCKSASEGTASFENVYQGRLLYREVRGLLPGVEYVFRVQAFNGCGASGWSRLLKVSTRPGAPAAPLPPIIGKSTSDSMTVSWSPPDSRGLMITGFTVQVAQSDDHGNAVAVTGLENGGGLSSNADELTSSAESGEGSDDGKERCLGQDDPCFIANAIASNVAVYGHTLSRKCFASFLTIIIVVIVVVNYMYPV